MEGRNELLPQIGTNPKITKHSRHQDEQLEIWKAEQLRIASQVIVRDDGDWVCLEPAICSDIRSNYDHTNQEQQRHRPLESCTATNSNAGFRQFSYRDTKSDPTFYGGVDVSFPDDDSDPAVATYILQVATTNDDSSTTLSIVYQDFLYFDLTIPYTSSFLAFREIDPLESLVQTQLRNQPQFTPAVILVDGNGILHARRAGIACFLGIRTGIRTIGIGKTLYCQDGLQKDQVRRTIDRALVNLQQQQHQYQKQCHNTDVLSSQPPALDLPLAVQVSSRSRSIVIVDGMDLLQTSSQNTMDDSSFVDRESILKQLAPRFKGVAVKLAGASGAVLCAALVGHGGMVGNHGHNSNKGAILSRCGTKNPIYISVGHNISLDEAILLCGELSCARIPEPVRQADLWGRKLLREKVHKT